MHTTTSRKNVHPPIIPPRYYEVCRHIQDYYSAAAPSCGRAEPEDHRTPVAKISSPSAPSPQVAQLLSISAKSAVSPDGTFSTAFDKVGRTTFSGTTHSCVTFTLSDMESGQNRRESSFDLSIAYKALVDRVVQRLADEKDLL